MIISHVSRETWDKVVRCECKCLTCVRMYRLRGDKTPIQTGRHTSDHRLLSQHAPSNKKCSHHSSWKPDSKEFTPTYIEHIKSHLPCGGIKANLNSPPRPTNTCTRTWFYLLFYLPCERTIVSLSTHSVQWFWRKELHHLVIIESAAQTPGSCIAYTIWTCRK